MRPFSNVKRDVDWNIKRYKNTYIFICYCSEKVHHILVREAMPDVLLPKNCFNANQIATFKWADRHHIPNGCPHLFIANVSKKRERSRPTTPRVDITKAGKGVIRRVTAIQREFLRASHREGPTDIQTRCTLTFTPKQTFYNDVAVSRELVSSISRWCTCSEKQVWGCALRERVELPGIDPLICTSRDRPFSVQIRSGSKFQI